MQRRATVTGYTLIELIIALLVFVVGVLALAASSGVVTKATANNATRELVTRTAVSRIETIESQCATASSGRETRRQIESEWIIAKDPTTTEVTESVRCPAVGRVCTASYRATVWCPP